MRKKDKEILKKMDKIIQKNNLSNIKNLGDELRFERLYYNYLNPKEKVILSNSGYVNVNDQIVSLLNKKYKSDYNAIPQKGFSLEIVQNIEKMNKEKMVYSMDIYYERLFYLFKLYGFLNEDSYILRIIDNYNIFPKDNKEIQEKIYTIKKNYRKKTRNERIYQENINLDYICLELDYKDLYNFVSKEIFSKELLCYGKTYYDIQKTIGKTRKERINFNVQIPKEEISNLTNLEKWISSLEIGKETSWLDDLINNKIKYISIKTLIKLLEFLELDSTDLYYFAKQIEKNKDYEMKFIKDENVIIDNKNI